MKTYHIYFRDGTQLLYSPLVKSKSNSIAVCIANGVEFLASGPKGTWVPCSSHYCDQYIFDWTERKLAKSRQIDETSHYRGY